MNEPKTFRAARVLSGKSVAVVISNQLRVLGWPLKSMLCLEADPKGQCITIRRAT